MLDISHPPGSRTDTHVPLPARQTDVHHSSVRAEGHLTRAITALMPRWLSEAHPQVPALPVWAGVGELASSESLPGPT